ncbi:MAG: DUF1351 domain-containing protein [Oceanobacter sp.]
MQDKSKEVALSACEGQHIPALVSPEVPDLKKNPVFLQVTGELPSLKKRADAITTVTKDNYDEVKDVVKALTSSRSSVEAERKARKEPYLKSGKTIDNHANAITSSIKEIEEPLAKMKKSFDEEAKRKKAARIARLKQKVDEIYNLQQQAENQPSGFVAQLIEKAEAIDTDNDFFDLTKEAKSAQAEVLKKLTSMFQNRLGFEKAQAEKAQAEAELAEKERQFSIQNSINAIRMAPTEMLGKPKQEVEARIADLKGQEPDREAYAEHYTEACSVHALALSQLEQIKALASEATTTVTNQAPPQVQPPKTLEELMIDVCSKHDVNPLAMDELLTLVGHFTDLNQPEPSQKQAA